MLIRGNAYQIHNRKSPLTKFCDEGARGGEEELGMFSRNDEDSSASPTLDSDFLPTNLETN